MVVEVQPPATETAGREQRTKRAKRLPRGADLVIWLALVCGALVMAFPLYWMFATAVRPAAELFTGKFDLVPSEFAWSNFSAAWDKLPWGTFYQNSVLIAVIGTCITVFINLLAGYAFAKFSFKGRDVIFILMISTLMVPIQVILVPTFMVVSEMGLVNSIWGVILPRGAEAFGIFLVRQYLVSVPNELMESARLDGASEFRIFWSVVLPLCKPVIAVLTIFTFMWRWNDFALPLVTMQELSSFTVPLGLNFAKGLYYTDWTGSMAMTLLSIIPMLIVFVIFQRSFVQGIASTGMK
ncbi:carbohydrate ABC transporter membrane protein 2 (CUT1 family) [Haloactinopolyspora alba]|uniref:Carbohydrate ABC transporter membrane protein 2 (CUT1 family) n=1 Tax=Haloactinopolyspora alba TaxID=648780 RepID=A0A2P8DT46_9ACTN|nr:carbohydrate ABC transporter permease [Haloactinopolyspora alba]PSL00381.1 carbohydrate ABC transporter membrane protein 2 (CUT1 family) [Haloactinopolyspora alba]